MLAVDCCNYVITKDRWTIVGMEVMIDNMDLYKHFTAIGLLHPTLFGHWTMNFD